MFFVALLLLLSIVSSIVFIRLRYEEVTHKYEHYIGGVVQGWGWVMGFFVFMLLLVAPICISTAVNICPELMAEKQSIITLESQMTLVESGHYSEIESGQLIGGAIDNLGQSVAYTEYLKEYAIRKANFNKELVEVQMKYNLLIFRVFSYHGFIPSSINDISKLK